MSRVHSKISDILLCRCGWGTSFSANLWNFQVNKDVQSKMSIAKKTIGTSYASKINTWCLGVCTDHQKYTVLCICSIQKCDLQHSQVTAGTSVAQIQLFSSDSCWAEWITARVCVLADVAHITQRISCVCLWIKGFKSACGQSIVSSDSVQSKTEGKTLRQMHSKIACVQIRKL